MEERVRRRLGILSVVLGALAVATTIHPVFVPIIVPYTGLLSVVLGLGAVICGGKAAARGSVLGWLGAGLGVVPLIGSVVILILMALQNRA